METFIDSLLDRLLATSVQTALLATAVWLLCRLVPRLSPATQCWLWWLVALQVLLGLCVDPVRLPWLPQAPAAVPLVMSAAEGLLPAGTMALSAVAERTPSFWQAGLFLLWVSGFAVMCRSTLRDWRRARVLLQGSTPCTDESVLRALAQVAGARRLGGALRLRMSDSLDSPMVIGHLRPVLLLPAHAALSGAELEMAVAHELEHLRRNDLWWGLVPALARHCFFFHPLVHVAVREYGIAREAACDTAAVSAGQRSRRDYGQLLLRLGTAAESSAALAVASPTFRALSRRLILLQHSSFLPRAGSIAVLILAVAGVMPLRLVAAVAKPVVAHPVVVPESVVVGKAMQPVAVEREVRAPDAERVRGTLPKARAVRVAAASAPLERAGTAEREQTSGTASQSSQSAPGSGVSYAFRPNAEDYRSAASQVAGEEGVVKISLCYDETGKVTESTLVESSGFTRLDEAALRMGKSVRMKPGVVDGTSQAGCVVMPVRFAAKGQEAEASQAARYTGERMTANFQSIPFRELLRVISETSGRTIVVDESVTGSVTMRINNVPWDQALDIVLRAQGLEQRVQGNEIVITAAGQHAGGSTTR